MTLIHLEPKPVWKYFEDICKIPRLSKNENKIRKFLLDFANSNNLESQTDRIGNVLICKQADPGKEKVKAIVLQSHMDMVGEKNAETVHDWLNDPIKPYIDGEWVTAGVTTLGADDGIGIAAQMAVLTDPTLFTGKIECLFTVDEESGMSGAIELEPGFFESKILINLDSEDEGELFIGCAGGIDTVARLDFKRVPLSGNNSALLISVTGLHGGHSGDEIHNDYGNSVKLITELLTDLIRDYDIRLNYIDGGNLRNAIPRESFASIVFDDRHFNKILKAVDDYNNRTRKLYALSDPDLIITARQDKVPDTTIDIGTSNSLLKALIDCPHGVIDWSKDMEGLVETSTNLASVKTDENSFSIVTSQRSSVEESKHSIAGKIEEVFKEAGADVGHSDGYPGWQPNTESEILAITEDAYTRLFGKQAVVRAIHAGLECGLILEKYQGLDMISFGPTIKGAHTPQERINIETTKKFWDLLLEVIRNIPDN